MKTIEGPAGAPAPTPALTEPTFPAQLTPFEVTCTDRECRAKLLVDTEKDLAYFASYICYGDSLSLYLVVTCPHCNELITLEEYQEPGSPASQTYQHGWRTDIPMADRVRAYKRWESSRDRTYWISFFGLSDVRYWAAHSPRAARKLKSRLLRPWSHADLRVGGVTQQALDLLGTTWADRWAAEQSYPKDETALANAFLLRLDATLKNMPFSQAREIALANGIAGKDVRSREALSRAFDAVLRPGA